MFDPRKDRWPPVYDAEGLAHQIRDLIESHEVEDRFFVGGSFGSDVFQGDVVRLPTQLPLLDETGTPSAGGEFEFWLVLGNTCDFDRVDVDWSQVVPIDRVPAALIPSPVARALGRFETYRRFLVPAWPGDAGGSTVLRIAELIHPVTVHKRALREHARVVARMSHLGWMLLHACVVRFLARDDGRHAP